MNVKRILFLLVCFALAGCALKHPDYQSEEMTPIDWGLEEAFENVVTVLPFEAESVEFGYYAGQRMQEYLLQAGAFRRVLFDDDGQVYSRYVLQGAILESFYGGSDAPTRMRIEVRVIDRTDGHTRFFRSAAVDYEMHGVDIQWLRRLYVDAPRPEEVLCGMLKNIAEDIAERTSRSAVKKCD